MLDEVFLFGKARKTHGKRGETLRVADIRKEIVEWLDNETPDTGAGTARYRRLTATKDLLEKAAAKIDKLSSKSSRVRAFPEFKNYIKRQYEPVLIEISEKWRISEELKKKSESALKKKLEIDKQKSHADKLASKLKDELGKLESRKKEIADAISMVNSAIPGTLLSVIQTKTPTRPAAVLGLLRAELAKTATSSGNEEAEKNAAKNAMKVLAELPDPLEIYSGMQEQPGKDMKSNQLAVLDKMIAHLRYAFIDAERNGKTQQVEQIRRAIKAALAQRAGMAYIRPSSAFLRSSYAGTGLQGDPGLAWRNMLAEQGGRILSHGGHQSENNQEKTTNSVIEEIDKQFWQNINKVRVAGGGDTNYVLAKDDVGNWYVKSYQTSRKSIFKSALQSCPIRHGSQARPQPAGAHGTRRTVSRRGFQP